MTKRWDQVRPEVAQRLMAALDAYERQISLVSPESIELRSCLQMARAEAAPKLRTRAEVDAEIATVVRGYHSRCREGAMRKGELQFDSFSNGEQDELNRLCVEPIAREAEQPLCPECERPMSRYGGAGESGWTCIVCNAAGDADRDHPEPYVQRLMDDHPDVPDPDPCSCEEAEALKARLGAIREILDEVCAPVISSELRKSYALAAMSRIYCVLGPKQ